MLNKFQINIQTKARRVQAFYKYKEFQGLELSFSNARTFKFCTNSIENY